MTDITICKHIDHTLLKANATEEQILKLCSEAEKYNFASVCVNPCFVTLAKKNLKKVSVCTVIGFPLGANTTETKVFETEKAISDGADEIDMVINIGAMIYGKYDTVLSEIKSIKNCVGEKILKVIVETAYLTDELKVKVCEIVKDAGADFIKTSTGFAPTGAKLEDILLFKRIAGGSLKIKASGGIKDYKSALEFVKAGADRIGTSSSVNIAEEEQVNND